VPIQWFYAKLHEQRGLGHRVSPEPEEVLQPKLLGFVAWKKIRGSQPNYFVPECPHGVKSHGLVPGRKGNKISIRPIRIGQVIIQRIEK
jgi:hypothetical protein